MTRKLLHLNGVATLFVVVNHAIGWMYVAMFWWTHRYADVVSPNFDRLGGVTYYGLRLIEQLISFGVPAFLLISGYFVSSTLGKDRAWSWSVVLARIRTLAVPFLIWSIVMLAANTVEGEVYSFGESVQQILLGRVTPAFYFVPLLVQLYLLGPILVRWARQRPGSLLAITATIQVAAHLARYASLLNGPQPVLESLSFLAPAWFFPSNAFWFALGLVVGLNRDAFVAGLQRYRWALLVSAVLLLAAGMVEWEVLLAQSPEPWLGPRETLVDNLYTLAFLLWFLSLRQESLPLKKPISSLGAKSYGVYLSHSLALTYTARAVYHLAPRLLGVVPIYFPTLILVGLAFPLVLMWLTRRSPARGAYRWLYG